MTYLCLLRRQFPVAFYYSFLLVASLSAIGISWFCRISSRRFFLWWILWSVVLGVSGLFVPWRTASGSDYGAGSPIPWVIWERIESGSYIDFPNPLALVLNPIAVYLVGLIVWAFTDLWWRLSCHLTKR